MLGMHNRIWGKTKNVGRKELHVIHSYNEEHRRWASQGTI